MRLVFFIFLGMSKAKLKITTVTLKQLPEELHRTVKRIQLDMEEEGEWKTLEEIYIELLNKGLNSYREEKAKRTKRI